MLEMLLLGMACFMVVKFTRSQRATQSGQMKQTEPTGDDRFAYGRSSQTGDVAPGGSADGWASVRSTSGIEWFGDSTVQGQTS